MFQLINRIVIGNSSKPLNQITPIAHSIKITSKIELFFPDLNDRRGNLIKWIGLTIKKQTNDKVLLKSLDLQNFRSFHN